MADDYFDFCLGVQQTPPSETARAMRRLAKKMEQQYQLKFHLLSEEFLASSGSDKSSDLRKVMEEMVGDGKMNWGRVVSLFAFTGVLVCILCSRGEGKDVCCRLAETIADFLSGEKGAWLEKNGGWEGFRTFSSYASDADGNGESSVKTALFAAAGVGIAGLTFLLVR